MVLTLTARLEKERREAAFERDCLLHGLDPKRGGFGDLPAVRDGDVGSSSQGAGEIGLLQPAVRDDMIHDMQGVWRSGVSAPMISLHRAKSLAPARLALLTRRHRLGILRAQVIRIATLGGTSTIVRR